MKTLLLFIASPFALMGCASNAGIASLGDGVYVSSSAEVSSRPDLGSANDEQSQQARLFCEQQGKKFTRLAKPGDATPAAYAARELTFCCEAHHSQMGAVEFMPDQIFVGRSKGQGVLKILLGKEQPFTVESVGVLQSDGSLRLDQTTHFEGKPPQSRFWIMSSIGAGQYAATLSDAAGPVSARTEGERLILSYPLTHYGLKMNQTLDLSEDGRTIDNYGSMRLWGVQIGHLHETITRIP